MADREITVRLRAQIDSYQQAMRRAADSTAQFGKAITGHGKASEQQIEQIGRASMVTSAVLGGAFALSAKAAVDWESSFAGVAKTVDGTAAQMKSLEAGLRDMATELPASASEIAGVAAAAGALGVKIKDVESFTETMIALGVTTDDLSAEQAATSIARLTNIMGTAGADVERLASTLVDLGNSGASTEGEILELATRLAAAGSIAGLSEADVLAFAATLSSVGVEAEAGGTALSKVFTSVRDAVIDGGDKLEVFAGLAGQSTAEFSRSFREDAAGAIAEFIAGLGELSDSGQSTTAVFEALELTDQRLMRALLSTAEAGGLLTDQLDLAAQAWRDNTALQTEAEQRYATTSAQLEILRNQVVDMAIGFGETLLPAINGVVDVLGNMIDGFGEMPTALQGAIGVTGGLATGLTGVIGVVGIVGPKLRELQQSLKAMEGLGATIGNNLGKLGGAMAGIGVAVVGASLAWEAATRSAREYRDAVAELGREIADVIDGQQRLNDVLQGQVRNWAESVSPEALEMLDSIGIKFADIEDAIASGKDALDPLREAFARLGIDTQGLDVGQLKGYGVVARQVAEELGISGSELQRLINGLEDLDNISQDAARAQLVLYGAASDVNQAIVDEAIAANTAADGSINYAGAARDVGIEAGRASGGVDELSDGFDDQVSSAKSASEAVDDVINAYRSGFDATFAYLDAQQAVEESSREAAEAGQAIADAQRDAADAAAEIENAQIAVAKAMMDTFDATKSAQKGLDDYISAQQAAIDPVFAMIRALEDQQKMLEEAANPVERSRTEKSVEGHGVTAKETSGKSTLTAKDVPTALDIAEGNVAVDTAAARLAGAIATGQVSIEQVRATLATWVRQGRLSAEQAAELGEKMDVAAAQAENLEGANVRGAIASRLAADEAEFQAEKAEKIAEAQGRVEEATRRAEDANRRVAEAMADAGSRAEDAARKHLDLEAAALRLAAAMKDNPALLQEMVDTVDRWVDRGFFSEEQGAAFKQRLLDAINGAIWTANELDLKIQAELVLMDRDGQTRVLIPGGGFAFAEGGIMSYANGGVSQAHIASMQTIKYAEPQTGGEAFIPRNGPLSKAMPVMGEAAGWYGMEVRPAGSGAVDNSLHVTVQGGLAGTVDDLRRELQSVQSRRSIIAVEHQAGLR